MSEFDINEKQLGMGKFILGIEKFLCSGSREPITIPMNRETAEHVRDTLITGIKAMESPVDCNNCKRNYEVTVDGRMIRINCIDCVHNKRDRYCPDVLPMKKPIIIRDAYGKHYECPTCGGLLSLRREPMCICKQILDWSEV